MTKKCPAPHPLLLFFYTVVYHFILFIYFLSAPLEGS